MSVRGYAKWDPKPDARYWVQAVANVLHAYKAEWPLTNRQVFYRLVAEYQYEKSETGYGKLTQMVSRARRAEMLPWAAIRDGGLGRTVAANYFQDGDHFEASVREWAADLHLNRQRGQEQVVELWCEAGGMVPILESIAKPYSARVNTGGGYDSVTAKHRLAERVRAHARLGLKTLVLHVGDFDGSGEDMCNVLREDAGEMVLMQVLKAAMLTAKGKDDAGFQDAPAHVWDGLKDRGDNNANWENTINWADSFFTVERVALTGQQVIERNVVTAPPKKSDSRSAEFINRNWEVVDALGSEDISAQLEALTPPELRQLITEVLEDHLDLDIYQSVLDEEADVRTDLLERLDRD